MYFSFAIRLLSAVQYIPISQSESEQSCAILCYPIVLLSLHLYRKTFKSNHLVPIQLFNVVLGQTKDIIFIVPVMCTIGRIKIINYFSYTYNIF